MWILLLAATLALPSDTLQVRPGDVLIARGLAGDVVIEGTDGSIAEILAGDAGLALERRGSEVRLVGGFRRGEMDGVHLRIPRGVGLRLGGSDVGLVIEGMRGGVEVDLMEGDVSLSDLRGSVRVKTFSGDLGLTDAAGRIALSTMDGDVDVGRVRGDVLIDVLDGDLTLLDVEGMEIHAETIDGEVTFMGAIEPGGRLALITHDGDVTARVPADLAATVEVGTFAGNFESDFPVRVRRVRANQALRFELGDGSGQVVMRSFDGDIRLLRR